ncbi:hypothetical protein BED47_00870 [Gottfriedia luciferensis]|uniref:Uncharacterized protein n=1 Tax=Gottfriedia luciferensis TaxID=178774 RepID=A0ABX3A380_9BACI|nr:hypothetical protein [Gottfriedia luciferensis]ODG93753.1 hypothetical protein BED47_00870 [Gottfriedia luciferensis]
MKYQTEIVKKDPVTINGQFGVYSFVAKLNKQKKTGVADTKIVQLKILCGGQTLVHYDYGWVVGHKFISLYQPLVEHLDEMKVKKV